MNRSSIDRKLIDTRQLISEHGWNPEVKVGSLRDPNEWKDGISLHLALCIALHGKRGDKYLMDDQQQMYDVLDDAAIQKYPISVIHNQMAQVDYDNEYFMYLHIVNTFLAGDQDEIIDLINRAIRLNKSSESPSEELITCRSTFIG